VRDEFHSAAFQSATGLNFSHSPGCVSLTPGFSPVTEREEDESRFNGFLRSVEAAEAAEHSFAAIHRAEARC
jgi:hypothetical protein